MHASMLQIDFSTSLMCSIEKGIVKRQLLFSDVKNCHEATGTRFSISFRGRTDYELEAASLEDKQKVRTSRATWIEFIVFGRSLNTHQICCHFKTIIIDMSLHGHDKASLLMYYKPCNLTFRSCC